MLANLLGYATRRELQMLAMLIVLLLSVLLSPPLQRLAIARCPAHSIEVGRSVANEPSCLGVIRQL